MLSDEEKILTKKLRYCEQEYEQNGYLSVGKFEAIKEAVNLIEKQSKEIEHQKEKRENQKQELAILNAKQIEFNKLVNTVNSYKGQFKRQQKEIEELKETLKCTQNSWYEDTQKIEEMKKQIDLNNECEIALNNRIMDLENADKKWEDKIKAKIQEVEQWELYNMKIPRLSTLDERLGAKIGIKYVLQSLLEKE